MPLANRKDFRDAGYRREDTTIALVWSRDLPDGSAVIIYSEVRSELEDARPQGEWEPCAYYRFHEDLTVTDMGHADSPLAAIEAAAQIGA